MIRAFFSEDKELLLSLAKPVDQSGGGGGGGGGGGIGGVYGGMSAGAGAVGHDWASFRSVGAGLWYCVSEKEVPALQRVMEKVATAEYKRKKDPTDAAILYCALGKVSMLARLHKVSGNQKLFEFFSRDFSMVRLVSLFCFAFSSSCRLLLARRRRRVFFACRAWLFCRLLYIFAFLSLSLSLP